MSAYLCTFERIGRTDSVPPLTVEAGDADEIAVAGSAKAAYNALFAGRVVLDGNA